MGDVTSKAMEIIIGELHVDLAASELRNRELQDACKQAADCWLKELERADELQGRLDAAENVRQQMYELAETKDCLPHARRVYQNCALLLGAAISPTPAQPAAGEESTTK